MKKLKSYHFFCSIMGLFGKSCRAYYCFKDLYLCRQMNVLASWIDAWMIKHILKCGSEWRFPLSIATINYFYAHKKFVAGSTYVFFLWVMYLGMHDEHHVLYMLTKACRISESAFNILLMLYSWTININSNVFTFFPVCRYIE